MKTVRSDRRKFVAVVALALASLLLLHPSFRRAGGVASAQGGGGEGEQPKKPKNSPPKSSPPKSKSPVRATPRVEMVLIPAGTFLMGSTEAEAQTALKEAVRHAPTYIEWYDSEYPQHRVTMQSFYMSKYEITQAQWQAVMGNNPSRSKGQNLPVDKVTWHDATEFCRRLSQMTGQEYRLPTEAEWEYACRAGTMTPYAFGATLSSSQANFDPNWGDGPPEGVARNRPMPVGSFKPNAFGVYDMHGNVQEWCLDLWHENYNGAPTDGSAWLSDGNEANDRILHGGTWSRPADDCRCAGRKKTPPEIVQFAIGFRVVAVAQ